MTRLTLIVAIVATILPFSVAVAQQKTNVGIIDLAQVFKSHPTFNRQLEKLQQDAEVFKQTVQQQRQQLQNRRENLAKMKPNSAQFQK